MAQKGKKSDLIESFGNFSRGDFGGGFVPAMLGLAVAFAASGGNIDGYTPDSTGTAAAEEVTAAHKMRLGELKIMGLELERLQLENSIRNSGHNTAALESAFHLAADDALHNLYTTGMTGQEAAISEKTFAALHSELTSVAPAVLGRAGLKNPGKDGAGALDECLADLTAAGTSGVGELNNCMISKKPNPALVISLLFGAPLLYGVGGALARRRTKNRLYAPQQRAKLRHGPH